MPVHEPRVNSHKMITITAVALISVLALVVTLSAPASDHDGKYATGTELVANSTNETSSSAATFLADYMNGSDSTDSSALAETDFFEEFKVTNQYKCVASAAASTCTDTWCNANCNHRPSYCPASWCELANSTNTTQMTNTSNSSA